MPFSLHRPAAEESLLPPYTSSSGSSIQTDSVPSEPPPAKAPHISNRPSRIFSSLLPHRLRSRLDSGPSLLSAPPLGPSNQAGPSSSGPESSQKQPVTLQTIPYRVQVCPHEFLSFERLQRIMNSPGFKGSYIVGRPLPTNTHQTSTSGQ